MRERAISSFAPARTARSVACARACCAASLPRACNEDSSSADSTGVSAQAHVVHRAEAMTIENASGRPVRNRSFIVGPSRRRAPRKRRQQTPLYAQSGKRARINPSRERHLGRFPSPGVTTHPFPSQGVTTHLIMARGLPEPPGPRQSRRPRSGVPQEGPAKRRPRRRRTARYRV